MENDLMESLKGKSREERKQIFESHKQHLFDSELDSVNGGAASGDVENPNSSECPYNGCWYSSRGYICRGKVVCG